MGTNRIQGYEADPDEVRALADQILADLAESLAGVTDPLERYSRLCADQVREDAVRRAVVAGIVRMRGIELHRMADGDLKSGVPTMTQEQIADVTGLGSKQRVSQLIAAPRRPRRQARW